MLDADILARHASEWITLVVLVRKRNGSWHFAVDFRRINAITKPVTKPLPTIVSIFDSLGHTTPTIFSSLDIFSGYFQIPLDDDLHKKAGIITPDGVYSFKCLPFSLSNAVSSFQAVMMWMWTWMCYTV